MFKSTTNRVFVLGGLLQSQLTSMSSSFAYRLLASQELTPRWKTYHYIFADASHNPSVALCVEFLSIPADVDCMGNFVRHQPNGGFVGDSYPPRIAVTATSASANFQPL